MPLSYYNMLVCHRQGHCIHQAVVSPSLPTTVRYNHVVESDRIVVSSFFLLLLKWKTSAKEYICTSVSIESSLLPSRCKSSDPSRKNNSESESINIVFFYITVLFVCNFVFYAHQHCTSPVNPHIFDVYMYGEQKYMLSREEAWRTVEMPVPHVVNGFWTRIANRDIHTQATALQYKQRLENSLWLYSSEEPK